MPTGLLGGDGEETGLTQVLRPMTCLAAGRPSVPARLRYRPARSATSGLLTGRVRPDGGALDPLPSLGVPEQRTRSPPVASEHEAVEQQGRGPPLLLPDPVVLASRGTRTRTAATSAHHGTRHPRWTHLLRYSATRPCSIPGITAGE